MLILSIPFNTGLQLDQSLSRLDLEPVLPPVTGLAENSGARRRSVLPVVIIYNHPWRHVTLKSSYIRKHRLLTFACLGQAQTNHSIFRSALVNIRRKALLSSVGFRKPMTSPLPRVVYIYQRGRVVSASDSQSGGPGFESRSGHLLDLCSVVPSSNSRPRL